MPLIFRGPPILTPNASSVRFTAYSNNQPPRLVVCHITRGALQALTLRKMSGGTMLRCFEEHLSLIHRTASAEFDRRGVDPVLTEENMQMRPPASSTDAV